MSKKKMDNIKARGFMVEKYGDFVKGRPIEFKIKIW